MPSVDGGPLTCIDAVTDYVILSKAAVDERHDFIAALDLSTTSPFGTAQLMWNAEKSMGVATEPVIAFAIGQDWGFSDGSPKRNKQDIFEV